MSSEKTDQSQPNNKAAQEPEGNAQVENKMDVEKLKDYELDAKFVFGKSVFVLDNDKIGDDFKLTSLLLSNIFNLPFDPDSKVKYIEDNNLTKYFKKVK